LNGKTVWVRERFHEQRESPLKTLTLRLKKGVVVEELDWDSKTEAVTIHRRLILEDYKWLTKKEDKKNRYLDLVFRKEDLGKAKKRKMKLIKKILADQYPTLSYSFFGNFISSTQMKVDSGNIDIKKIVKEINKSLNKSAQKIKMKEKQDGVKI